MYVYMHNMYVCIHNMYVHNNIFRGLPIMGRDKQMIWKYLRTLAGVPVTLTGQPTAEMKKKTLVFASASTWGVFGLVTTVVVAVLLTHICFYDNYV